MNNATLHPKPGGISLSSFVLREQTMVIGSSPSGGTLKSDGFMMCFISQTLEVLTAHS